MSSDYVINYCQQFLSNYLPIILPLAFLLLIIGFTSLTLQLYFTNRFIRRYLKKDKISIPDRLYKIVWQLGLLGRVDVVDSKKYISFCYGYFSPRICLSSQVINSLSDKELQAILLHESYHLKSYDPLKIVLSKTLSSIFFFIPILKDLQKHYILTKEIAADTEVIQKGGRQILVSVLSKFLTSHPPVLNTVAALASPDDLEKRILYLGGKKKAVSFQSSVFSVSASTFMIVALLIVVSTPVYATRTQEEDFCKVEKINDSRYLPYTPLPDKAK